MTTFAELTDEVLLNLMGDSLDQNEQTFITGSLDGSATTFTVDEPRLVSQGLIEIDDELMWVKSVNQSTGLVTLSTLGRGFRSTTATSHSSGATVTNNPRYSRFRVKQTINTAIRGVYPDLYVLGTTEFSYVAARLAYEMPAATEQVHRVYWQTVGPSRVWLDINDYQFVPDANTTSFPSGKAIYLWGGIIPGRTVRVTYLKAPSVLVNNADDFVSVSGLPLTSKEVIVYGACYRLVGFMEAPRLQTQSVEASSRSEMVPPGAGLNGGRFFFSLYQEALANERERLLRVNKASVVRTRRIV
jgi:hypothetical protein